MLVFSRKNYVEHPPLPTILSLFGYFHILTYQVAKLKQNTENPKFCALIGCHCTKGSHKCAKLVEYKRKLLFCCEFAILFNGQKPLTRFISSCLTTVQLIIKNSEIKK